MKVLGYILGGAMVLLGIAVDDPAISLMWLQSGLLMFIHAEVAK